MCGRRRDRTSPFAGGVKGPFPVKGWRLERSASASGTKMFCCIVTTEPAGFRFLWPSLIILITLRSLQMGRSTSLPSMPSDPATNCACRAGHVHFPDWVPPDHPAREILSDRSGTTVAGTGSGVECTCSDIQFRLLDRHFYLPKLIDWERLLETVLIGIADVHHGHGELYVASDGMCYCLSCVHDAFSFLGKTFCDAEHGLVTGMRAKPMVHPSQDSVTLWGEVFDRRSPHVYHPRTLSYCTASIQAA